MFSDVIFFNKFLHSFVYFYYFIPPAIIVREEVPFYFAIFRRMDDQSLDFEMVYSQLVIPETTGAFPIDPKVYVKKGDMVGYFQVDPTVPFTVLSMPFVNVTRGLPDKFYLAKLGMDQMEADEDADEEGFRFSPVTRSSSYAPIIVDFEPVPNTCFNHMEYDSTSISVPATQPVPVGESIEYSCVDGKELIYGDLKRTCDETWDSFTPPICVYNFPKVCVQSTVDIRRSGFDGIPNKGIYLLDQPFACAGVITHFGWTSTTASTSDSVYFAVWRRNGNQLSKVKQIKVKPRFKGVNYVSLDAGEFFVVQKNDYFGFHYDSFSSPVLVGGFLDLKSSQSAFLFSEKFGGSVTKLDFTERGTVKVEAFVKFDIVESRCPMPPPSINNTEQVALEPNIITRYVCVNNFEGNPVRTCQLDGSWSPPSEECQCRISITRTGRNASSDDTSALIFTHDRAKCYGLVTRWLLKTAAIKSTAYLGIWRGDGNGNFKLVGTNIFRNSLGKTNHAFDIPRGQQIRVRRNDYVGIHYDSEFQVGGQLIELNENQTAFAVKIRRGHQNFIDGNGIVYGGGRDATQFNVVTGNLQVAAEVVAVIDSNDCRGVEPGLSNEDQTPEIFGSVAAYQCENDGIPNPLVSYCLDNGQWSSPGFCAGNS